MLKVSIKDTIAIAIPMKASVGSDTIKISVINALKEIKLNLLTIIKRMHAHSVPLVQFFRYF